MGGWSIRGKKSHRQRPWCLLGKKVQQVQTIEPWIGVWLVVFLLECEIMVMNTHLLTDISSPPGARCLG